MHQHAEAFCNMKYVCQECGHSEMVWNSRDGVTPFIIGCTKCDGDMCHIGPWNKEKTHDTIPDDTTMVFVQVFEKVAVESCTAWVDRFYDQMASDGYLEEGETKENLIEKKVEARMKDDCPCIITREQYLAGYHLN
jgi:hypothetical protein